MPTGIRKLHRRNFSTFSRILRSDKWVGATWVRNYMMNDPLIDWLSKYSMAKHARGNTILFQRGKDFESAVIAELRKRFPVITVSERYDMSKLHKVKELMEMGTPIIHSAPVCTVADRTFGVCDILIRSDYINRVVRERVLAEGDEVIKAPGLSGDYHYLVIDIKFCTLPLTSDGVHVQNTGKMRAYKSQLYIYTSALQDLQGMVPRCAYILGRRWIYTKNHVVYKSKHCFDRLGCVDFACADQGYVHKTSMAVRWVRDLQKYGSKWQVQPPSRPELYPNMCVDSGVWNGKKEELARSLNEITMLWNCGVLHRDRAHARGVYSWKDPRFTTRLIGLSGEREKIVNKIVEINSQHVDDIMPNYITNNLGGWKTRHTSELFVDFETFPDIMCDFKNVDNQYSTSGIFMIGVGRIQDGRWVYTPFISPDQSRFGELRIIAEFNNLVDRLGNPPLYYWHAEQTIWKKRASHVNHNWIDMHKIFTTEPIVIRGCFNYKLKHVGRGLTQLGLIDLANESTISDGFTASTSAWTLYDPDGRMMGEIKKYNEYDCRLLQKILYYLREYHI
jgi:hypothetical protein